MYVTYSNSSYPVSQADQSGTVTEILVEDGKSVSVDMVIALFPSHILSRSLSKHKLIS